MTSPAQFRAARAILGWSQAELAKRANGSVRTVARAEHSAFGLGKRLDDLQRVLEDAGVTFSETGDTVSVTLKLGYGDK